jgi:HEPN domain-containing protein
MDVVRNTLLNGYKMSLEKARKLASIGMLPQASYHLYVALQLRAAALLRLVDPASSHTCSVTAIMKLIEKALQRQGPGELAERFKKIEQEYRDAVKWAEKVHTLVMYKPVDIPMEMFNKVLRLINELEQLENELLAATKSRASEENGS